MRAGLGQEQLAQRAGLSVRTISYLESGQVRPRAETVRLLASALELDGPDQAELAAIAHQLGGGHGPAPAATPHRSPLLTPAQLPGDVAGFTGRSQQLGALSALLAGIGGADADQARALLDGL